MKLSDTAAAAVVAGLASCTSLQTLSLPGCSSLTALPDMSSLTSLQTLNLACCDGAARPLGAHALQTLNLRRSTSAKTALPDLSALTSLQTLGEGRSSCTPSRHCPTVSALTSLQLLIKLRLPHGAARPVVASPTSSGARGAAAALQPWEDGGLPELHILHQRSSTCRSTAAAIHAGARPSERPRPRRFRSCQAHVRHHPGGSHGRRR